MITSVYEKATVSGLFETHLQVPSVSIECLIEELEYLRDSRGSETNAELHATVVKVYKHLDDMNATVDERKDIRLVDLAVTRVQMLKTAGVLSRKRS